MDNFSQFKNVPQVIWEPTNDSNREARIQEFLQLCNEINQLNSNSSTA